MKKVMRDIFKIVNSVAKKLMWSGKFNKPLEGVCKGVIAIDKNCIVMFNWQP